MWKGIEILLDCGGGEGRNGRCRIVSPSQKRLGGMQCRVYRVFAREDKAGSTTAVRFVTVALTAPGKRKDIRPSQSQAWFYRLLQIHGGCTSDTQHCPRLLAFDNWGSNLGRLTVGRQFGKLGMMSSHAGILSAVQAHSGRIPFAVGFAMANSQRQELNHGSFQRETQCTLLLQSASEESVASSTF